MPRLSELSRQHIDEHIAKSILEEMDVESPRTTAVVGGALVENCLDNVLLSHLVISVDDPEYNDLFLHFGPLSTFAAKITIAHAMGAFGEKTRHDLRSVRRIRNAFAHAAAKPDFSTPAVSAECKGFHCLRAGDQSGLDCRQKFVLAVKLLAYHLLDKSEGRPLSARVRTLD